MHVHQYLCGRLSTFIWRSISTYVSFDQLSYGCPLVCLWTSATLRKTISFLTELFRGPSAFIWTSISTSVDVHQLSYGCPLVSKLSSVSFLYILPLVGVYLWTSINFHTDVQQYLGGCPSTFIWTSISTSVDVHLF